MEYATLVRISADDLSNTIDEYAGSNWVVHTLIHIPGTAVYTILFERP